MSSSKKSRLVVPEARKALDELKMEAAKEVGVDLQDENLRSRDAGSVGGTMTKRMIEAYESSNAK
jgi:hypothetical protein